MVTRVVKPAGKQTFRCFCRFSRAPIQTDVIAKLRRCGFRKGAVVTIATGVMTI
jgi:hypothetical protein